MHEGEDPLGLCAGDAGGADGGRERAHGAADDGAAREAHGPEGLHEYAHDLRLGLPVGCAHELHAQLGELAGLAGEASLLAHHGGGVAQARREVALPHPAGDEPGDG